MKRKSTIDNQQLSLNKFFKPDSNVPTPVSAID